MGLVGDDHAIDDGHSRQPDAGRGVVCGLVMGRPVDTIYLNRRLVNL